MGALNTLIIFTALLVSVFGAAWALWNHSDTLASAWAGAFFMVVALAMLPLAGSTILLVHGRLSGVEFDIPLLAPAAPFILSLMLLIYGFLAKPVYDMITVGSFMSGASAASQGRMPEYRIVGREAAVVRPYSMDENLEEDSPTDE